MSGGWAREASSATPHSSHYHLNHSLHYCLNQSPSDPSSVEKLSSTKLIPSAKKTGNHNRLGPLLYDIGHKLPRFRTPITTYSIGINIFPLFTMELPWHLKQSGGWSWCQQEDIGSGSHRDAQLGREVTREAVVLWGILTEEAKVPIRCERCQADPEGVSRSARHSGVPGRHGKPLEENSPGRRQIKFTSHMEHVPGKHRTVFRMLKQELGKCHSVSHRVGMQTFSFRSVNLGISLVI